MDRADELVLETFNNGEGANSVNVKLIWGVAGIDDSTAKKWDAEEFGDIIWDDSFTLAPIVN